MQRECVHVALASDGLAKALARAFRVPWVAQVFAMLLQSSGKQR